MATSPDGEITVATATPLEARAVRRAAPGLRLVETGVGLVKVRGDQLGEVVISCGLAGGLRDEATTGSVVVPTQVITSDGETITCDPALAEALARAAQQFAKHVERGPLLTSSTLVNGPARALWAARGCVAVDMETGFIKAPRLAAVRVILDSPSRELSEAWLRPATALVRPGLWPQGLWLLREGPRCARLAARILAAAFTH